MQETIPTPALLILVVSLTDKKEQGLTSLEPQPVLTFVCFHACACFKRQPRDSYWQETVVQAQLSNFRKILRVLTCY